MEGVHVLHYHGGYSFSDVMAMTYRERLWLLDRMRKQYDQEAKPAKDD